MQPEISVVMSVFNGGKHLPGAVESILSQEGADFEFVIIDDGSTDGSGRVLDGYAAGDPRVRIIRQDNTGLTRALIRGCAEARGAFIARQDADDSSLPGRLARLSSMLRGDGSLAFVSSLTEYVGPEDEPLFTSSRPVDPEVATRQLLYGRTGPEHGSVMFRREAYEEAGGYRAEFYYAQDADLWLRMGLAGRVAYAQEVLYRLRISERSISGARHYEKLRYAGLIDRLHALRLSGEDDGRHLEEGAADLEWPPGEGRSSRDRTLYFIGSCLTARGDGRGLKYLARCLGANPLNWRAWIRLPAAAGQALRRRLRATGGSGAG